MIEFRCLGPTDIRGAEGAAFPGLLSGSKRLALLSHLALARPRGFQRRDVLLALFWPDSNQQHARTSLRNMLHQIRSELGSGVVVNRGNEEIGIAEGALWCDATEMEERIQAGRLEHAMELYRGDLLEGLHVPDAAPELERWLDGERERLRRLATETADALLRAAESAGELELAIRRARRVVELSPWNEEAVRTLIALLVRVGKRGEALHAYEALVERLRTDLEMEPSPETELLAREVRERAEPPGPPVSRPVADVLPPLEPLSGNGAEEEVPPPAAAHGDEWQVGGGVPVRGRGTVVAASLAIIAVSIGILLAASGSQRGPFPEASSTVTRIAILPFTYRGPPAHAYLGEGMVDLLSAALDGVDGLQSANPHALTSVLRQESTTGQGVTPREARRVAERLRVERYVVGSITATGGSFQLQAALHDAEGQRLATVTAAAPGEEELLAAVESLARQLLAEELARTGDRLTQLGARTTSSLPALKSYLLGMQLLRRGEGASAGESFGRAIQADSTFALAYYGLAVAGGWGHIDTSLDAMERALRWAQPLPERDRLLLEGYHAEQVGRYHEAEQLYGTIVATAPDHVAAWFRLGDVLFHQAVLTGRSPSTAREAFERVLSFEPDHAFSLIHLTGLICSERRIEDLTPVTERMLEGDAVVTFKLGARAQLAFLTGDSRAQRQTLAGLDSVGNVMNITMTALFLSHCQELEGATQVADLVARNAAYPAHARLQLLKMTAEYQLGLGRWDAARERLREAAGIDAAQALAAHAYLATTPSIPVPRDELLTLRRRLRNVREPDTALPDAGLPGSYIQHYLLGLLSARLGDESDAMSQAARLSGLPEVPQTGSLQRDLAATIRAYSHSVQRRPARALEELQTMRAEVPVRAFLLSQTASLSHARLLRAETLHTLGREEEALRWYASSLHSSVGVSMNMTPAHLGMARIHDARGERERAVEHYQRATRLWQDADASLRHQLVQGEQRLLELARTGTPVTAGRQ